MDLRWVPGPLIKVEDGRPTPSELCAVSLLELVLSSDPCAKISTSVFGDAWSGISAPKKAPFKAFPSLKSLVLADLIALSLASGTSSSSSLLSSHIGPAFLVFDKFDFEKLALEFRHEGGERAFHPPNLVLVEVEEDAVEGDAGRMLKDGFEASDTRFGEGEVEPGKPDEAGVELEEAEARWEGGSPDAPYEAISFSPSSHNSVLDRSAFAAS